KLRVAIDVPAEGRQQRVGYVHVRQAAARQVRPGQRGLPQPHSQAVYRNDAVVEIGTYTHLIQVNTELEKVPAALVGRIVRQLIGIRPAPLRLTLIDGIVKKQPRQNVRAELL